MADYYGVGFDRRRTRALCGLVGSVVLLTAGWAVWVHEHTGRWSLDPHMTLLQRVSFNDRDYHQGGREVVPDNAVECSGGRDMGNRTVRVLVSREDGCEVTNTLLWVQSGDESWSYGLSGGP